MAVYSMTGYASAQQSAPQAAASQEAKGAAASRLGLEIRSVNSRFLDLSFRLSEELRQHEPALRELIAGKLKRGKVEVRAALETGAGDTAARAHGPHAAAAQRPAGQRAQLAARRRAR